MAHSPDCHVVLLGQAGSPMLVYSVLLPPPLVMFDLSQLFPSCVSSPLYLLCI